MFRNIDWALTGQGTVYVILVLLLLWGYLAFVVWVGRRLHEMDAKAQEKRAERCRRLALLITIAEEVERTSDSVERRRLYREGEHLGFLDSDDLPRMEA